MGPPEGAGGVWGDGSPQEQGGSGGDIPPGNRRGEEGPRHPVGGRQYLTEHPGELLGHLPGRTEPAPGIGMRGPPQQPGKRLLLLQQRHTVREAGGEAALEAPELEGEHGQRPAHRIQVRADRGPVGLDLGRLVPNGPVDGLVAVDPPHAAHVDELELLLGLDHVVRLEIAVHQAAVVQVPQRHRDRAAGDARVDQDLLERLAAHVLHHDVPGRLPRPPVRMLHEVIDPHDIRVLDLGQELALGHGSGHRIRIAGVQQALEHHPAVADIVVPGQVDPAEPAVRQAAEHLVLPRHQVSGLQLRAEREPGAAVAAETLGHPGSPVPVPADRLIAAAAVTLVLRDLRVGEDGAGGVAVRHRRDLHQPGAQPAPRRPAAGAPGPGPGARTLTRARPRGRTRRRGRRGCGEPAGVAVPVLDGSAAARLSAGRHGCTPRTACW